jgi:hypothetical protein
MHLAGVLAGIWVMLSPYLVGFAPAQGNPWTGIVLGTVILGAGIVLSSVVGLTGFWGLHLKDLQPVRKKPDEGFRARH